jgi:hypothetical protein
MNHKLLKFATLYSKIILTMKKILASIVALTAVTGFAGVAHAGGTATSTVVGTPASQTSIHSGSAAVNCTIVVADGSLPNATTLVNDLTSPTAANISTVCNTATSTLTVGLAATIPGTDDPGTAQTPSLIRTFNLVGVDGAYAGVNTGFVNTYNQTPVHNGFSSATSNVGVIAKIAAPTGQNLAAGPYIAKILATLTP